MVNLIGLPKLVFFVAKERGEWWEEKIIHERADV
jgi:hypothetical protein